MINLTSDTVTKPTPAMLEAMFAAEVGDDVFGADPTVNDLEEYAADRFGMEAALFCPSGTMTNQLAIKVHTQPLDEVICDELSHIYQYETGGWAFHSGVSIALLAGKDGKITADQVAAAIKPEYDWLPQSRLVVVENTCNKGGGNYYHLAELQSIAKVCRANGLSYHLDGARLFNALVETNDRPFDYGQCFDSISICLSKGLGAPVGSLLLGTHPFIKKARRFRKVFGGGMRQAGYLAAAGKFALENNITRLKEDHRRAEALAEAVIAAPFCAGMRPVKTNIIIFDLTENWTADSFITRLKKHGIAAVAFGPQTVRFTTHLDFDDAQLAEVVRVLEEL